MSSATINSLENTIKVMKTTIDGLETRIEELEDDYEVVVTRADLQEKIDELTITINEYNTALTLVEEKVKNVLLPDDTRYYLKESEVGDFRSNFRTLRALIADVEKTRQAFIRLAARYNLTNSQNL